MGRAEQQSLTNERSVGRCEKSRKRGEAGWPAGDSMEGEEPRGAQSTEARETENGDSVNGGNPERSLLEAILDVDNMFKAQERVIANRGSAGIDGMTVGELNDYLIKHYLELCGSIRGGWYNRL